MKLSNITMKKKMALTSLVVGVLPIMVLTVLFSIKFYYSFFEKTTSMLEISVNQLAYNVSKVLENQKQSVLQISENSYVLDYVNKYYLDDYQCLYEYQNKILPFIKPHIMEGQNKKVRIYNNNESLNSSSIFTSSVNSLYSAEWFDDNALVKPDYFWNFYKDETEVIQNYLVCYRGVHDVYRSGKLSMIVSVSISEENFYSLFAEERKTGRVAFVCDQEGNIIASTTPNNSQAVIDDVKTSKKVALSDVKNKTMINYNEKKYLYFSHEFENSDLNIHGWKIFYMIPYGDIMKEQGAFVYFFVFLFLIAILLSVAMMHLFSKNLTNRIAVLTNKMNIVSTGDFSVTDAIGGKDEIGQIDQSFNAMVEQINALIKSVYESDIQVKDAQILNQKIEMERKEAVIIALQSQINPHYLYNTLETIRMKLVLNNDEKTAEIVCLFAESFREYMSMSKNYVTVREELTFINKYITIQQFRFGDKIKCYIFSDDKVFDYLIPKLIVQPVVENAVYHGLELKESSGNVIIEVTEIKEDILIKVTDDGIGMSLTELSQLIDSFDQTVQENDDHEKRHHKIGIRNVNNRLKLLYGENYGIKINSKIGYGTEVEIRLKKIKGEDVSQNDELKESEI